jgi:hypothetical protein
MSVCVSVSVSVCLSVCTFPHFSTYLLQIWREPSTGHDTFRELYICLCARNVRARACVLSARTCVHSLIFERILSKFAGNILRLTISGNDYVLLMFTHRAHACERACARERVIKRSLIYGRILVKFAVNILQVTSSSMGYVRLIFTHRARACASVRVVKTFTYLWTDSLQICCANTTHDHKLFGLHIIIMFTHRAHVCVRACARARVIKS